MRSEMVGRFCSNSNPFFIINRMSRSGGVVVADHEHPQKHAEGCLGIRRA